MDHYGGVVDAMSVAQRSADHQHGQQIGRSGDDIDQGVLDGVQQHVLQQDVLDGVAGQRQLGENGQRDTVVVALPGQPQNRVGVGRGVADRRVVCARGDAGKALAVGVVEVHCPSIVAQPASILEYLVVSPRPAAPKALVWTFRLLVSNRETANIATCTAPSERSSSSWTGLRTMLTSGTSSFEKSLTSISPRFDAAAVCTRAE